MTSDKKTQANRRNSLKSTGPKTPEGKAAVRYNATKHGLLSKDVLLPGEDEAALRELGERLGEELQPIGELESLLVDRIIASHWRLRRLGRVEAGIFLWQRYEEGAERAQQEARTYEGDKRLSDMLEKVNDFMPTDEKKREEALTRVRELKAKQGTETAALGGTFIRDADGANAFSKLSRYETTIERSLYKALHELQRLQAARYANGNVLPPVAIDVDVSGVSREEF
ncbi:MAG: hypothetical protein M3Q49_13145 [Actinomycetota bacterium]|nr:hypothetical protein [Actinomycetota bacterium]